MIDFELRPEINTSETQRMVYEAARDFGMKRNIFPLKFLKKQEHLGLWECLFQNLMEGLRWDIMNM